MGKSKGNPNWIKGGPSPNPNGRKSRKDGRDVAVGTAEALALLQGLRQDGWENLVTGLGQPGYDKAIHGTFALDVVDDATAFALWKGDDIGRKIVEVWPDEMLRRPFEIRVGTTKAGEEDPEQSDEPDDELKQYDKPDPSKFRKDVLGRLRRDAAERRNKEVQEQVKAELKRLDVVAKLKEALQFRRAYGGSGILIGVEDEVGDISKPLGKVIRKLNFLTVFERRELTPVSYYNDPQKENYRKVSVYQLNAISPGPGLTGEAAPALDIKIHESRLLLFGARPVSQGLTASLTPGWDFSEFTSAWRVLRSYQSAWGNTDNLLETFALAIWKLKDLALLVSSNNGQGAADLKQRMQLMAMAQSVLRATVIDVDEDYQRQTVSLTGIPEILSLQMTRVASAVEMPVTRLFGSPPKGLDATGETDLQFFDNRVEGKQKDELQPEIEKLVRVIMQVIKYAGEDWSVYYPDLRQMSELDSATARKTQADTDAVYIDRGVLTPEEVTLHRFGGDEYSFETPLDLDARALDQRAQEREAKAAEEMQAQVDMAKATAEAKGGAKPPPGRVDARKRRDWDPDQPRDEGGRWGEGGASGSIESAVKERFAAAKASGKHPMEGLSKAGQERYEQRLKFLNKPGSAMNQEQYTHKAMQSLHMLYAKEIAVQDPRLNDLPPARREAAIGEMDESAEMVLLNNQGEFNHPEFQALAEEAIGLHANVESALKSGHVQPLSRHQLERARGVAERVAQHLQTESLAKTADSVREKVGTIQPIGEDDTWDLHGSVAPDDAEDDYENPDVNTFVKEMNALSIEEDDIPDLDESTYEIAGFHAQLQAMARGQQVPDHSAATFDAQGEAEAREEQAASARGADDEADDITPENYKERFAAKLSERREQLKSIRSEVENAIGLHETSIERMKVAGKSLDAAVEQARVESGTDDEGSDLNSEDVIDPQVGRDVARAYEALPRDEDGDPDDPDDPAATAYYRAQDAAQRLRGERYEEIQATTFTTDDEEHGWKPALKAMKSNVRAYKKLLGLIDKKLAPK